MKQRTEREAVELIRTRFHAQGFCQVPGYNRFGYVGGTPSAVIVSREAGQDTKIPLAKLEAAVRAARQDPQVYDGGPSRLRAHGITHINSPIWALLHLVSKEEISA